MVEVYRFIHKGGSKSYHRVNSFIEYSFVDAMDGVSKRVMKISGIKSRDEEYGFILETVRNKTPLLVREGRNLLRFIDTLDIEIVERASS